MDWANATLITRVNSVVELVDTNSTIISAEKIRYLNRTYWTGVAVNKLTYRCNRNTETEGQGQYSSEPAGVLKNKLPPE